MTHIDGAEAVINEVGTIPVADGVVIMPCPCGMIHIIFINEKDEPIIQANFTAENGLMHIEHVRTTVQVMRGYSCEAASGTAAGRAY